MLGLTGVAGPLLVVSISISSGAEGVEACASTVTRALPQLAALVRKKVLEQDCRIWDFCCFVRAVWFGFGLRRHSGEFAGCGP